MIQHRQDVSSALHYLRARRISVSPLVPASPIEPTRWCVATYPVPFDAHGLVELAREKGFAAR